MDNAKFNNTGSNKNSEQGVGILTTKNQKKSPTLKGTPLQRKKNLLMKKIINIFILFLILTACFVYVLQLFLTTRLTYISDLVNLSKHKTSIEAKVVDLDKKSEIATHYIQLWKTVLTEKQKDRNGLSLENAKKIIEKIRQQNRIYITPRTNFTLPTILESSSFYKDSIKVSVVDGTIEFLAMSDIDVYNFLNDLNNEMIGFLIVDFVSMKKVKMIDKKYIENLKKDIKVPSINVKIKFKWYGFERNNKNINL